MTSDTDEDKTASRAFPSAGTEYYTDWNKWYKVVGGEFIEYVKKILKRMG